MWCEDEVRDRGRDPATQPCNHVELLCFIICVFESSEGVLIRRVI